MLYSTDDLATIAWVMATNIWEALEAMAAGSSDAASVGWQDYASEG